MFLLYTLYELIVVVFGTQNLSSFSSSISFCPMTWALKWFRLYSPQDLSYLLVSGCNGPRISSAICNASRPKRLASSSSPWKNEPFTEAIRVRTPSATSYLRSEKHGQGVQMNCNFGRWSSEHFLIDLQSLAEHRFCIVEPALSNRQRSKIVQRSRYRRMVVPVHVSVHLKRLLESDASFPVLALG